MRRPALLPRPSVSTITRRRCRLPRSPCRLLAPSEQPPPSPGQLETASQLSDGNCRCRSWSLPIMLLVGCLLHRYKSRLRRRRGGWHQELAAPGLHGVGGAVVPYYAYKFNFSTLVAILEISSLQSWKRTPTPPAPRRNALCSKIFGKAFCGRLVVCTHNLLAILVGT